MTRRTKAGCCGIAIGPDRVIAVVPRPGAPPEVREWPLDGPGHVRSVLGDALTALAGERDAIGVALLPRVAHVRTIEVPPLRLSETRAVVKRHASRYFPVVGGQPTVAVRRVAGGGSSRSTRVLLAAAAPESLSEAVAAATVEHGGRAAYAVPAPEAWARGAVSLWPALRKGGVVTVLDEDRITVMEIERDSLSEARTLPADDLARVADLVGSIATEGPVALIGPPSRRALLREKIDAPRSAEIPTILEPPPGSLADQPSAFAAVWASRCRELELVPDSRRDLESRPIRKLAVRLWVAAAALAVVAGGLELWGAHRELAAVSEQREILAPVVAQAMEIRATLTTAEDRISAARALDSTAPDWSGVLADVALHLPEDAYLAGLRGRADSLVLEGVAVRSAAVFEALGGMPGVVGVRAQSPIRREATREGNALERFTLAARLRPVDGARP